MIKVQFKKLLKLINCLRVKEWRAPLRFGVAAALEHDFFFRNHNFNTVVDIGANTGQFSLVMKKNFPEANIFAFEPLKEPFFTYSKIFDNDTRVNVFNSAIAQEAGVTKMHISKSLDSSSLLELTELQNEIFPGTSAIGTQNVSMGRLASFVRKEQIKGVSLLKLDVQGFELEVLSGCEELLHMFDMVYCECSFFELYAGQSLAPQIIEFMSVKGFVLQGFNNVKYDKNGSTVQADFIFCKAEQ